VIQRRQDLPQEAFCTAPLVASSSSERAIIVISYAWITKEHPDPEAFTLSIVAPLLQHFTRAYGRAAIFWDFCCMWQPPFRSASESAGFAASLPSMKFLYAHQQTWVWLCKALPASVPRKYDDRGWTHWEQAISAWIKDRSKRLDLSLLTGRLSSIRDFYNDVERKCIAARPGPATPARFGEQIAQKSFTNDDDSNKVVSLYEETFDNVMHHVQDLDLRQFRWRGKEIDSLIEALELAQPPNLRRVLLQGNLVRMDQASRIRLLMIPDGQLGLDGDRDSSVVAMGDDDEDESEDDDDEGEAVPVIAQLVGCANAIASVPANALANRPNLLASRSSRV